MLSRPVIPSVWPATRKLATVRRTKDGWREIPKQLANLYSEFRLSLTLRSKSQARKFIAIKVGTVAEEEQTF
jgi:hypothetical protein